MEKKKDKKMNKLQSALALLLSEFSVLLLVVALLRKCPVKHIQLTLINVPTRS